MSVRTGQGSRQWPILKRTPRRHELLHAARDGRLLMDVMSAQRRIWVSGERGAVTARARELWEAGLLTTGERGAGRRSVALVLSDRGQACLDTWIAGRAFDDSPPPSAEIRVNPGHLGTWIAQAVDVNGEVDLEVSVPTGGAYAAALALAGRLYEVWMADRAKE